MPLAFFRMLDNDSELYRRSVNYTNFGGVGGIRLGFDNSHLERPYFTHPPLVHVPPQFTPRCSTFPRMVEVDDMEGQVSTSSVQYGTPNRDVQMPDIESSDGKRESATIRSNQTSIVEDPRSPPQCHNFQSIGVGGPYIDSDDAPSIPAQRANYQPNHEYIPYCPLPPIQELLNSPPETPQAHPARRISPQAPNFIHLPTPGPPSSPDQSQFSTVSSDTIRANSNLPEDSQHLIFHLYYTCVDASAKYISSLRPLARHRKQQTRDGRSSRYHPYSPARDRPSNFRQAQRREPSLMDNISEISTHVWREARRNIMAPHRAEADAVRSMRNLYAWSELVVRSMENGGSYESDDDGRSSITGLSGEDDGLVRIAGAARKICGWLRDMDACGICNDMLARLRDLDREGLEEENVGRGESLDTSSDGIR